jgi:subtilisin family serine protease
MALLERSSAAAPAFRPDRLILLPRRSATPDGLAKRHGKSGRHVLRSYAGLGGLQVVQLAPGENVADAAAEYQASGMVEFAEPDYKLQATETPNDPNFVSGTQWSLQNNAVPGSDIHAVSAWNTSHSASNVVVAIVDSGIRYTHQDLAANMWVNRGEIPGNGIDDDRNGVIDDVHGFNAVAKNGDPMDDAGHGSHVAGIIGAVGNNGLGIAGVAWNVQLMACKFLAADESGDTSDAISCIDYARRMGAQIINASWGGGDYSAALYTALASARAAGIIVVTAAGNDAENIDQIPLYPACYALDNIVVVGATSRSDNFETSYSNFGVVNVDLCAPGSGIYSTWYTGDAAYMTSSGTSMATPHVAGALALMKARFTQSSSSELIARLLGSVDVLPSLAGKCATGGRLNLAAALGPNPAAVFSVSDSSGDVPFSVSFTNRSIGDVKSLAWDFGDGTATSTNENPVHVFARPGSFVVTLTVAGQNGSTNSFQQTVRARSNYEIVPENYQWIEPSGMTQLSLGDNGSSAQVLPFSFPFYGDPFTTIFVGANGLLGFSNSGLSSIDHTPLPDSAAPNGIICPYWDNLNPQAGGTVFAGVVGNAPNRRFVASWVNVLRNSSALPLTFQAILEESTSEIVFQYLNVQPQNPRGGAKRATVGIEDASGLSGSLYIYNGSPAILQNQSAIRIRPRAYDQASSAVFVSGAFKARIAFPDDGEIVIEASDDLKTWTPIDATPVRANGMVTFEEDASDVPRRFYRVRTL